MKKLGCTLLFLSVALVLGVGTAAAQDYAYDVGYYANVGATGAPSAHLRLTNDGFSDAENLCAAIYVFDNTEEMKECCSCEITANGYLDLSVGTNLLGNILDHGTKPTRGIIKVVSTLFFTPLVCSASMEPFDAEPGIKGWLTHVEKGATSGTFSLTETPLTDSYLSDDEMEVNLVATCAMVQSLGSGTGVCSCADAGD